MALYKIDASHSRAGFTIKHMMISKVHGGFEKVEGTLTYDPADPSKSKVEATMDASSINTGDVARDTHLKSADFFDVEKFPTLSFKSKRVEAAGGDELKVTGDLTIHGVTKEVILKVEGPSAEIKDPWGSLRIGVSASTKINRKDFGLSWNAALEAGGILVGEEVTIILELELTKQA